MCQDAVRERGGRGVRALGGAARPQLVHAARGGHRRGLRQPAATGSVFYYILHAMPLQLP